MTQGPTGAKLRSGHHPHTGRQKPLRKESLEKYGRAGWLDQVIINHFGGGGWGMSVGGHSRFKEVRMWAQPPQQLPEKLKGLETTGPVKQQSSAGGDRQWEEQRGRGRMWHQKPLQTQPTINPFVEETLAGGGKQQ